MAIIEKPDGTKNYYEGKCLMLVCPPGHGVKVAKEFDRIIYRRASGATDVRTSGPGIASYYQTVPVNLIQERYSISRDTLRKVLDALSNNHYFIDADGDEHNNEGVIEAEDLLKKEITLAESPKTPARPPASRSPGSC